MAYDEPLARAARLRFVCPRSEVHERGRAVRFEIRRAGQALPAFAVQFDGQLHAYINVCPHRGTSLDWQPGEVFDESGLYLICATHGALFEPDTGVCVDGPCRGACLNRIAIETIGTDVVLTHDQRVLEPDDETTHG